MNDSAPDAGIPLLTEVIEPVQTPAAPLPASPVAAGMDTDDGIPVLEVRLEPESDDARWERLEREVGERILVQLLGRIDLVLEQRVRDSLADVLQTAVQRLADDIRDSLSRSVRETVGLAVSQEIAALRDQEKIKTADDLDFYPQTNLPPS